jgi:hypothetical protein
VTLCTDVPTYVLELYINKRNFHFIVWEWGDNYEKRANAFHPVLHLIFSMKLEPSTSLMMSQDSAVSIVTRLQDGHHHAQQDQYIFPFFNGSRPALGPNQPTI